MVWLSTSMLTESVAFMLFSWGGSSLNAIVIDCESKSTEVAFTFPIHPIVNSNKCAGRVNLIIELLGYFWLLKL